MSGVIAQDQRVWIYCQVQHESSRVAAFCKETMHLRRLPQVVAPSGRVEAYKSQLKLSLHKLPAPYAAFGWDEFFNDVDALLTASAAEAARRDAGKGASRHPALLVTDLQRLCRLLADCELHCKVVEASGGDLKVTDLLPVVLAKDFATLFGEATLQPPRETLRSTVLEGAPPEPASFASLQKSLRLPHAGQEGETVDANACVGLPGSRPSTSHSQRSGAERVGEGADDLDFESKRRISVGSTQTDVQRLISGCGAHQEASGGMMSGQSMAETTAMVAVVPGLYVQRWKPPPETDSCSPRGFGPRCLALLSDGHAFYSAVSQDGTRGVEASGTWEIVNGQVVIPQRGSIVKHVELLKPAPRVIDDFAYEEWLQFPLEDLRDEFEAPVALSACVPKVSESLQEDLERIRKKCDSLCHPTEQEDEASTDGDRRGSFAAASPPAAPPTDEAVKAGRTSALSSHPICPLRPGFYQYESGTPGSMEHKSLELTLRGDQTYTYVETVFNTTVKSVHRKPTWHIHGDTLILSCFDGNSDHPGFEHLEPRGRFRKLQTHVQRIELSVAALQSTCRFTPLRQTVAPFPELEPAGENERIGGIVAAVSLATTDPVFDPDRIAIPRFEATLVQAGFNIDEHMSDLSFLDEDRDGTISANELKPLMDYPEHMAAPEVMCSLCEALYEVFEGDLWAAFAQLKESCDPEARSEVLAQKEAKPKPKGKPKPKTKTKAKAKTKAEPAPAPPPAAPQEKRDYPVTTPLFREWLEDCAAKDNGHALHVWLQGAEESDVEAVFASMDPENKRQIELADFMSLLLHRGMVRIVALDHFRRWLVAEFGNSEAGFTRAFKVFDINGRGKLTENEFAQRAQHMKYPGFATATDMFALLDVNFDGHITEKEFEMLRGFTSKEFSKNVLELRSYVRSLHGGVEHCFKMLLDQEEKLTGKPSTTVMFSTLQKAFHQSGLDRQTLAKDDRWTDLRMICIFLDIAAGTQARGELTSLSFSLIDSFDPRTFDGSPVRLRRFLDSAYGRVDEAFEKLRTAWLPNAISERLERLAFNGLVHAFMGSAYVDVLSASVKRATFDAVPRLSGTTTTMGGMTLTYVEETVKPAEPESWQAAWQAANAGVHTLEATILSQSSRSFRSTGLSARAKATMVVTRLAPLQLKTYGKHWSMTPRKNEDGVLIPIRADAGSDVPRSAERASETLPEPWNQQASRAWTCPDANVGAGRSSEREQPQRNRQEAPFTSRAASTSGCSTRRTAFASSRWGTASEVRAASLATPRRVLPNIGLAHKDSSPVPPLLLQSGNFVSLQPCTPRVPRLKSGQGAASAIDWSI